MRALGVQRAAAAPAAAPKRPRVRLTEAAGPALHLDMPASAAPAAAGRALVRSVAAAASHDLGGRQRDAGDERRRRGRRQQ